MKLGFYMGYAPPGTNPLELLVLAQEAERLGYDSRGPRAWGTALQAVLLAGRSPEIKLGSVIMQIPGARRPTRR